MESLQKRVAEKDESPFPLMCFLSKTDVPVHLLPTASLLKIFQSPTSDREALPLPETNSKMDGGSGCPHPIIEEISKRNLFIDEDLFSVDLNLVCDRLQCSVYMSSCHKVLNKSCIEILSPGHCGKGSLGTIIWIPLQKCFISEIVSLKYKCLK